MGRSLGSGPVVHLASEKWKLALKAKKKLRKFERKLRRYPHVHQYLHRRYLGIATLLRKVVDSVPAAVCLQSGCASVTSTVSEKLGFFPIDIFVNKKKIQWIRSPVLLIHGTDDMHVPFRHSNILWRNCSPSRWRFVPILQAGHDNIEAYQIFRDQLLAAMLDLLNYIKTDSTKSSFGNSINLEDEKADVSHSDEHPLPENQVEDDIQFLIQTKMLESQAELDILPVEKPFVNTDNTPLNVNIDTSQNSGTARVHELWSLFYTTKNTQNICEETPQDTKEVLYPKTQDFNDGTKDYTENWNKSTEEEEIVDSLLPLLPSCLYYLPELKTSETLLHQNSLAPSSSALLKPSPLLPLENYFQRNSYEEEEEESSRDYDETDDPDQALGVNIIYSDDLSSDMDEDHNFIIGS
jgi:hypothetical protein